MFANSARNAQGRPIVATLPQKAGETAEKFGFSC
jgi:hypothetical protein